MSQISPPIRIVLVAAIALIGAWMLFLRPKTETTPPVPKAPPTAPGVKGLTNDIAKAKGASKTSDAANAKLQAATGGQDTATGAAPATSTAKPSTGAAAAAATEVAGLPTRVQKALADKKVLVLFFYNPKSADDRLTKKAVAKANRWQGDVVVQNANVKSVARYGKIARGADVEQSPTIVVVDRAQKAEKLVGYQDTRSIDQAVVDALRNSGVLIKDRYLRSINQVCRTAGDAIFNIPDPTQPGAELKTAMASYENRVDRLVTRFKAVPAPARWRAFKEANVADLAVLAGFGHGLAQATGSGRLAPAVRYIVAHEKGAVKAGKSWDKRMDKHDVLSCGSNF